VALLRGHHLVAVPVGPDSERFDRPEQRAAEVGQLVLDARRRLPVDPALDETAVFAIGLWFGGADAQAILPPTAA